MIEARVSIAAPAWYVRETFLDFAGLSKWHSGEWIKSITVRTPGKSTGGELVPGDMMRTVIPGMQFDQTIQVNDANKIVWVGPWYGLLTGTHGWEFTAVPSAGSSPSSVPDTPRGDMDETCEVYQWETFTGILSPTMSSPHYLGGKATLQAFEGVNADLKAYCERTWGERRKTGEAA